MSTIPANPLDVCWCGDYRWQHDEHGKCKFNRSRGGMGHGPGSSDCLAFRLLRYAANEPVTSNNPAGGE
jgi:hypothetical protein